MVTSLRVRSRFFLHLHVEVSLATVSPGRKGADMSSNSVTAVPTAFCSASRQVRVAVYTHCQTCAVCPDSPFALSGVLHSFSPANRSFLQRAQVWQRTGTLPNTHVERPLVWKTQGTLVQLPWWEGTIRLAMRAGANN